MTDQVDLKGFGLANYRSFDEKGFVIRNPSKINVIIGKNNCGKSNVLRAISLLRQVRSRHTKLQGVEDALDGHQQKPTQQIATVVFDPKPLFAGHEHGDLFLKQYKEKAG